METNEISMFLDVKIDINDRKNEAGRLRNWTKCLVKVEAIKSFPCFLRITFIRNVEIESENLCVPIHVPGVQIRITNSRSKTYSYGLTWKHNRKRCHIFFAFESQTSFERHMKWLKESLKNLELHRRETRRTSRDTALLHNLKKTGNFSDKEILSSLPETKNLQDILGPLPKIPDKRESINWSRRISTVSGIYEEIFDSESSRRFSQASGIYEEMKPPKCSPPIFQNESPPELPARSRINTFETDCFETLPRSNTNPESIIAATKNKIFLQNLQSTLFGRRSKRCESVSECKVSTPEDLIDSIADEPVESSPLFDENSMDKHIYVNVYDSLSTPKKNIQLDRRNSFSNPDLSKISSKTHTKSVSVLSSNFHRRKMSASTEKISLNENEKTYIDSETANLKDFNDDATSIELFNISDRINESFNFSINSSTINLVGSNLNSNDTLVRLERFPNKIIDDQSGYCTMAPIKTINSMDHVENDMNIKNLDETLYLNYDRKSSGSDKENVEKSIDINQKGNSIQTGQNIVETCGETENHYQSPRKLSINIDEKVPSYLPNNCDAKRHTNITFRNRSVSIDKNADAKPPNNSNQKHLRKNPTKNSEQLYISSSKKIIKEKIQPRVDEKIKSSEKNYEKKEITPIKARKIAENVYSVQKFENKSSNTSYNNDPYGAGEIIPNSPPKYIADTADNPKMSFGTLLKTIDFKFDDTDKYNTMKNDVNAKSYPNLSELPFSSSNNKYLTIGNLHCKHNPQINADSNEKLSGNMKMLTPELSTVKKLASLPRFKKIDFSPLKLRINNVLQK